MDIQIQSLTFAYSPKGPPVLAEFSAQFGPGITLLKGYSGCGKSTLLRLIAGFLKPTKGRVIVPPEGGAPERRFQRTQLGFVFQGINLLPDASVHRNLEIAATLAGLDRAMFLAAERQWCGRLGLEPFLEKRPDALSGGQQQRAAIARALIHRPAVLCLDEPTSGLDDLNTGVIRETLVEAVGATRHCVIATHDDRLTSIATRVINFEQFMPIEPRLKSLRTDAHF
ncbi:MAG: ABC transporter ATP-binding protein [Rariglobus sp.]|nr:ATP-binding cassette domain-containing protein [Rariglobus sp.]